MRYQKILLARKSGHIYEQFCLVTFFVSGYYGKSTVEDVELVWFYRLNRRIWVWKSQIQIFGGKIKFDFLGYFASFLTFLEHLNGGEACKIPKKIFWGVNTHFEELGNFDQKCQIFPNIPKLVFPPKFQFILNFTSLPTIQVL